jgi:hypothetical protein
VVRGAVVRTLLLVVSVAVALAIAEGAFGVLLAHPALLQRLPPNLLSHLRAYYLHHDRGLLQALPECARYDPGLFYTLRPGTCRFAAREFDTEIRVNSAGLRDDEASLTAPEVIVAGDSFAMGWGVAQEEAFPQQLERLSGLRVLNAGVPSFGTVREVRLLDRLDTRRLRWLIVQYDDNDALENAAFRRLEDQLRVSPEPIFRNDLRNSARRRSYYPGKITFAILRGIWASKPEPFSIAPREEARYFVNALLRASRVDLSNVGIVAFELRADRTSRAEFALALLREISLPGHKPHIRGMRVLNLQGQIGPQDYFVLDDHLRASGHAKLARLLADELKRARTEGP